MSTQPRTLAAMVSVGNRDWLTDCSFERFYRWASKHHYTCILVKDSLVPDTVLPHYNKLLIPQAYPGFDRYVICDDDLLLSHTAPALPEIPEGYVGLAKDAVQCHTTLEFVEWTGNTGFIVASKTGADLLSKAFETGDNDGIWGIADQGALNFVLWETGKIWELDTRWNYQPVVDFFHNQGKGWDAWKNDRSYRLSYYLGIKTGLRWQSLQRIKQAFGIHLTRAPYPKFYHSVLP